MNGSSLGKHNPRLAEIRRAIDNGELTGDGLLAVEGPKLVEEARTSGLSVVEVFAAPGTRTIPKAERVYELSEEAFKKIQSTETSQGVVALIRPRAHELAGLIRQAKGQPIVVLVRLQNPGNVGVILRMAEAFNAAGCIGLEHTASVHNSKSVRASAGSVFRIPYVWNVSERDCLAALREAQIALAGLSPRAATDVRDWNWTRPTALLIGNEGGGLSDSESKECDDMLKIPHNPRLESLNSATAAAIVLYEAYRQKGVK